MAKKTKRTRTKKADISTTRSDSYVSVYSNQVSLSITKWDARMTFGDLFGDDGVPRIEQKVTVIMTHGHFEHLLQVMNELWSENKDEIKKLKAS